MRSVNTDSYLVIEVIGGLDAYCDDLLVCSLNGKTLADFTYDGKVDKEKLEDAIYDEYMLDNLMEDLRDSYLNL